MAKIKTKFMINTKFGLVVTSEEEETGMGQHKKELQLYFYNFTSLLSVNIWACVSFNAKNISEHIKIGNNKLFVYLI